MAGARAFDTELMGGVYDHPFTVEVTEADRIPIPSETPISPGRRVGQAVAAAGLPALS